MVSSEAANGRSKHTHQKFPQWKPDNHEVKYCNIAKIAKSYDTNIPCQDTKKTYPFRQLVAVFTFEVLTSSKNDNLKTEKKKKKTYS